MRSKAGTAYLAWFHSRCVLGSLLFLISFPVCVWLPVIHPFSSQFCVFCFVCLRPVSCLPNVVSVSGLSSYSVLCAQFCQCLWIVFVRCLVCPMLSLSLDCLCLVSCLPNVVIVFGLSSSGIFCAQGCQCLWIVFVWCLVCPILSVSLDEPFLIAPAVFSNVYFIAYSYMYCRWRSNSHKGLGSHYPGYNWQFCVPVPIQNLYFQHHISWSVCVQ